jgi:Predicted oxidoreductases of the aldo/keto reductase family
METEAMQELIPMARRMHVGVIAMKPVGGGNIRETALNFRFIFHQGVDVAIPGMDSENQVAANVAALENLAPLNADETARLQAEKDRLGDRFCRRCEYCMPCPQGLPISFLHVLRNYYFLYDLKDWARERLASLARTYKDCVACGECIKKCPYQPGHADALPRNLGKDAGGPEPGAARPLTAEDPWLKLIFPSIAC